MTFSVLAVTLSIASATDSFDEDSLFLLQTRAIKLGGVADLQEDESVDYYSYYYSSLLQEESFYYSYYGDVNGDAVDVANDPFGAVAGGRRGGDVANVAGDVGRGGDVANVAGDMGRGGDVAGHVAGGSDFGDIAGAAGMGGGRRARDVQGVGGGFGDLDGAAGYSSLLGEDELGMGMGMMGMGMMGMGNMGMMGMGNMGMGMGMGMMGMGMGMGAPEVVVDPAIAEEAAAVGDPHLTLTSGESDDLCCESGVCKPCPVALLQEESFYYSYYGDVNGDAVDVANDPFGAVAGGRRGGDVANVAGDVGRGGDVANVAGDMGRGGDVAGHVAGGSDFGDIAGAAGMGGGRRVRDVQGVGGGFGDLDGAAGYSSLLQD